MVPYHFPRLCRLLALVPALALSAWAPAVSSQSLALRTPMARCLQGYVWREAYSGDGVCVDPARRDAVRAENAAARRHVEPGGGAYGPDTCRNGYVWREAGPGDHVCVSPESRSRVAGENGHRAAAANPPPAQQRAAAARADGLRRRLAQRQRDLAQARENERRAAEALRRDDAAWARAHPGLGRSSQPSTVDNVSPIEQDIRELQAALREAERQAAGTPPPRPRP